MKFLQHIRFALRAVRKRPGLFVAATLILGAGIGINTALFSLLHAVLLRPIPGVAHADRLIRVRRTLNGRMQGGLSYPDYVDLRDGLTTLAGLAAERLGPMRLAGPVEIVQGTIATGNYHDVLGVRPRLGRLLMPEDEHGPHPVVVLSEALWRRRYGSDPSVLGRTLVVNGAPFTIVGVAADPFRGVQFGEPTALWVPISMVNVAMTRSRDYHWLTERRAGWLTWYGRLRPGGSPGAVQTELDAMGPRLEAEHPDSNTGRRYLAVAHVEMTPEQRSGMKALFGLLAAAATLVLLIACGNIGNLLLARAAGQTREMAVRTALGASRRDLLWQPLAEAALIGVGGGLLGVVVAPWVLPILQRMVAQPIAADVLDARVLAFSVAATLVAILFFGVAPAWSTARADLAAAGLSREFAAGGRARGRMMRVWTVAQVALSLALVVNGALVLGSMRKIVAIDPGYTADRVAVTTMDLSLFLYTPERGTRAFQELIDAVSRVPGVRSATVAKSSPAVDWSDRLEVNGVTVDRNIIAPAYFRTLGIPLLAGRDFTAADATGSRRVAIVSKSMADKLWPDGNAIGQYVRFKDPEARGDEVIGVAADTRYRSILDAPPPILYSPLLQNYDSIGRLMVAVDGPPAQYADALRRAAQQANADLPPPRFVTLRDQIEAALWQRRAASSLLSLFGVLAVALACAGIYGVVSYATAQQTRDIAIRMALGVGRSGVLVGVLAKTVRLAGIGVAIGIPLALAAGPALATVLYGMGGAEVWAIAGTAAGFVAVAVMAAWLPARRAASVDPVVALRGD